LRKVCNHAEHGLRKARESLTLEKSLDPRTCLRKVCV
jgi:hypothetical protein